MADTLRIGDEGRQVKTLQTLLNKSIPPANKKLKEDGDFGVKTEEVVESFQARANTLADGVAGSETWKSLVATTVEFKTVLPKTISLDKYDVGYGYARLYPPTAAKVEGVRDELHSMGGILTSSGGLRSLDAPVGANRSATSFHYSGRALDLFVYSGLVNPHSDPFVIEREDTRLWRVWARVTNPDVPESVHQGYTYDHEEVETVGRFVDLTRMFEVRGLQRISARSSFFSGRGGNGAAEWWHFQDEAGLVEGQTFFGQVLASQYSERDLKGTKPWSFRDRLFGVDWF